MCQANVLNPPLTCCILCSDEHRAIGAHRTLRQSVRSHREGLYYALIRPLPNMRRDGADLACVWSCSGCLRRSPFLTSSAL